MSSTVDGLLCYNDGLILTLGFIIVYYSIAKCENILHIVRFISDFLLQDYNEFIKHLFTLCILTLKNFKLN